ncbi:hypothetical protein GQR58_027063 [Nymphon striatum]|nr:hypothetical protein GQR58_027063 [Nymphon striatum]
MAYEMIVMAFADEDRKTLKNLLAKDVYDGFAAALDDRSAAEEVVQTNFVGIENIEISAAELKDNDAQVTVSVISQLISATRDKAGEVIDGDPESVVEVRDVWTFARDIRQKDPNWKLATFMWTAAPITFDEIVGWADDDHGAALQAFQRQALRPSDEKYKLGDFGIDPEHLDDLVHLAGLHKTEPRSFFENHFTPVQVLNDTVTQGKITGFYEPECAARLIARRPVSNTTFAPA